MKDLNPGKKIKIEDVKALLSKTVHIKDKNRVEELVNRLVRDGKDKLQVILDFDQTMTKQHVNGNRCLTSFGIFGECKQLPSSYKADSGALYRHYRALEIDPKLTREQKMGYMLEWYIKAQDLLRGYDFDCQEIYEVVEKTGVPLRDGSDIMLKTLDDASIPVLVFSAGLGDIVSAILKYHGALRKNVQVISNFLNWEGSQLNGFKGNVIHAYNKNEHAIENSDYFQLVTHRPNVILMGDVIGDADMAEGVHCPNAILKIGFLYDKAEECLEEYLNHFDIVLVDDQTMNVMNALLQLII